LGLNSLRDQVNEVGKVKDVLPLEELCGDLPKEFVTYLQYCRSLKFDEVPDYMYMKGLF